MWYQVAFAKVLATAMEPFPDQYPTKHLPSCADYSVELGRHGQKYMDSINFVRSEEKALATYGMVYGDAAERYGKAYAALPSDSKVYQLLVKHATKGVGGLNDDSTEGEIKKVLEDYHAKFLEPDKDPEGVILSLKNENHCRCRLFTYLRRFQLDVFSFLVACM